MLFCFDAVPVRGRQVIEKEWRHWTEFFEGSNARLGPNGRCDCHRTYSRVVGSKTVENRYFWLPNGKLNLSFFNVLGTQLPVVGRWAPCASPHVPAVPKTWLFALTDRIRSPAPDPPTPIRTLRRPARYTPGYG